jgi:hypothetical protein
MGRPAATAAATAAAVESERVRFMGLFRVNVEGRLGARSSVVWSGTLIPPLRVPVMAWRCRQSVYRASLLLCLACPAEASVLSGGLAIVAWLT